MKKKAKYDASIISSWFIGRCLNATENEGEDKLSLMKLLKLLYYAEGCSLGMGRGSLFDEQILAWEHGPIVRSIWDKYHESLYNIPFTDEDRMNIEKIENNDCELLEGVYEAFGGYSAWGLRNKTHEEDPWKITTHSQLPTT